jgi:excisionase family DNA binding protein
MTENRKLNHRQACAILGCKKSQFYRLIKKGELAAYRAGSGQRGMWVLEFDCLALVKKASASMPDAENEPESGL